MNISSCIEMKQSPLSAGLRSYAKFAAEVGWSSTTAWRARVQGKITTINISGRLYVTDEAIAEFKRRAVAGEFEKASGGAAKRRVVPV